MPNLLDNNVSNLSEQECLLLTRCQQMQIENAAHGTSLQNPPKRSEEQVAICCKTGCLVQATKPDLSFCMYQLCHGCRSQDKESLFRASALPSVFISLQENLMDLLLLNRDPLAS